MTSGSGNQFGRNVFVLDISGSMGGMKCQTLQLSATRIIEDIPDNSFMGIVLFDSKTEVAHKVIQINSRSVRDALIKSVPAMARGGTDIERGVLCGIQTLRDAAISTEGANLFLVTDGEDYSGALYVDRLLPTLLSAKIRIVCIAIGRGADPNLERLANETNGKTYSASDSNKELAARVIESTIQEVQTGTELTEAVYICICDDILQLSQSSSMKNVTIDPDIGRNTVFTIGSDDIQKISVVIHSPNGHKYDSKSPQMTTNLSLKRIQLRPVNTETGVWSISLNRLSDRLIKANLSVKSQPLSQKAIKLKVTLKEANTSDPPIIIAELLNENEAVVDAEVTAIVDRPDSTQSKLKLNNYNNIYCNYFTDYCGSGRYNVTVLAQNLSNNCKLKSLNSGNTVYRFERQLVAACFKITDSLPQRPNNDSKLQELSLSTLFSSMSLKPSAQSSLRTNEEAVRPKNKAVPKIDEIKIVKENIYTLLLVLKKLINSQKITDNERNAMKDKMADIDNRLSPSDKSITLQELNNYLKQLEELKQKLN